MFDQFTDDARRVLVLAHEEARMLSHRHVDTEHILLGLIHQADGSVAAVLEALGLTLADARTYIESHVGRGDEAPSRHMPFTPQVKAAMALAGDEALESGYERIAPKHLLLGLVREDEGVGPQTLRAFGGDLNALREALLSDERISVSPVGPEPQAITELHHDRLEAVARQASSVIGELPSELRLNALNRTQEITLRALVQDEMRASLTRRDWPPTPRDA